MSLPSPLSQPLVLPKAAFFDWDGTLADSFECIQGAHDYALAELCLPARGAGWFRAYFGKPRDFIYSDIYGEHRAKAQTIFEHYLVAHHTRLVTPLAGVKNLLEFFQKSGVVMGVVTNKRGDFVGAEIESFGWAHYFATVVGAGEAEADKPSSAPLALALQRAGYGGAAADVWFFGDTQADLDCAKAAGAHALFYGGMRDDDNILRCIDDYGSFLAELRKNC